MQVRYQLRHSPMSTPHISVPDVELQPRPEEAPRTTTSRLRDIGGRLVDRGPTNCEAPWPIRRSGLNPPESGISPWLADPAGSRSLNG